MNTVASDYGHDCQTQVLVCAVTYAGAARRCQSPIYRHALFAILHTQHKHTIACSLHYDLDEIKKKGEAATRLKHISLPRSALPVEM